MSNAKGSLGIPKKMKLISCNRGGRLHAADKAEQCLVIHSDGRIHFMLLRYPTGGDEQTIVEQNCKIDSSMAADILAQLSNYLHAPHHHERKVAPGAGCWNLTLTDDGKQKCKGTGPLCQEPEEPLKEISDDLRAILQQPMLIAFGGAAAGDRIERLSINYQRVTKIKANIGPLDYVTWDYMEYICIDRATETLLQTRNIGSACQVKQIYHIDEAVSSLLDELEPEKLFRHIEGNPPDEILPPLEKRTYKITVDYLFGKPLHIEGTFDKDGLPDDFAEVAGSIWDFMRYYGFVGEILDASLYEKPLRRHDDLIFCNVTFDDFGKEYCYLTDDDTLEVGDYVLAPVGRKNHEAIVQIQSIEYHPASEAPYPVDKIKKIIRKCADEDFHHADEESKEADASPPQKQD